MVKIAIIAGSSRVNGTGDRVLNHFKRVLKDYNDVDAQFMVVRDYDLPFYDGQPPLAIPDRHVLGKAEKWVNDIKEADGYIILTPEYNRSVPGVLKNGIDYLGYEIQGKPVKIVSYSVNIPGGNRAATALVDILHTLNAVVLPTNVSLGQAQKWLNEDGSLNESDDSCQFYMKTAQTVADEIQYYAQTLKNSPYRKY